MMMGHQIARAISLRIWEFRRYMNNCGIQKVSGNLIVEHWNKPKGGRGLMEAGQKRNQGLLKVRDLCELIIINAWNKGFDVDVVNGLPVVVCNFTIL